MTCAAISANEEPTLKGLAHFNLGFSRRQPPRLGYDQFFQLSQETKWQQEKKTKINQ